MSHVVIDTQIVVWHRLDTGRLTSSARQAIADAPLISSDGRLRQAAVATAIW